jgi:hypothetical protein
MYRRKKGCPEADNNRFGAAFLCKFLKKQVYNMTDRENNHKENKGNDKADPTINRIVAVRLHVFFELVHTYPSCHKKYKRKLKKNP